MTRLFAGTQFDIPPTCDLCGKVEAHCQCSAAQKAEHERKLAVERQRLPPEQQTAKIQRQKRKGGRVATVIEGLTAAANDLPQLLKQLQAVCGSGGTVKAKQDLIELQGDHLDTVRRQLKQIGYRVKG
ncbi:translation initiation factor [Crateriforma conspicua]|uniref:Translation initiation factor Sui1 n=1 Tax=Crateriforma conspicua TaxID=2527996 RepID=A0A5C5YAB1_9PLAN|nr:translation initiation factor [Crateriforma conspicua]QDV61882.1 translation initiation factor Sui1 [Crateriforma conspicua]TWT71868.1 translation initiation factor Sui1 [Crateriforma conspicua]